MAKSAVISIDQLMNAAGKTQRKARKPTHDYSIKFQPYQIQPFLIAPVLPGETLKNLHVQGRYVSDPLAVGHPSITPWWIEHTFYYVRLRDILPDADVKALMLENTAITGTGTKTNYTYHHCTNGVDFTKKAVEKIVTEYFRDEGEGVGPYIDGVPAARVIAYKKNWLDSYIDNEASGFDAHTDLQVPHDDSVNPNWTAAYERMRMMGMLDGGMDFEDWLGTYGVKLPGSQAGEEDKPELLRYTSAWQYPTNTVDPASGNPSSAYVESVNERADKDRYFKEPGFIIGCVVVKPKLYRGNQSASLSHFLYDAYSWLPALMRDDPETSLRKFDDMGDIADSGPLRYRQQDYWVDMRDLFLYGDQFVNVPTTAEGGVYMSLPTPVDIDGQVSQRYLAQNQIAKIFKVDSACFIRAEGTVRLDILSHPTQATDNT